MDSRMEQLLNSILNGTTVDFQPQSRMEQYLKACCNKTGTEGLPNPMSRADALLYRLAENIAQSGDTQEAINEALGVIENGTY